MARAIEHSLLSERERFTSSLTVHLRQASPDRL
jgi:hypothetical protein